MLDKFRVGVIVKPHGIKGEAKVYPTSDDLSRFKKLKACYLDTKKGEIPCEVTAARTNPPFIIMKFKGIDSANEIEALRNTDILVDRENAIPLAENEYFIADLIGFKVISDEDEELGTLSDIMQTGANDVYVVDSEKYGEILIPSIPQCVLDIKMDEGIILVHLLKGLID